MLPIDFEVDRISGRADVSDSGDATVGGPFERQLPSVRSSSGQLLFR